MKYDPKKIEKHWQKEWAKQKLYETPDTAKGKSNYMLLTEFPYPSGNLHIGHWYAFALPDIRARYLRMKGYNVLYPIGFDAFGLPAENAAIEREVNPRDWTEDNIKYMTKQLASMGASFDWSREVRTIDPDYYRWTQWMFVKMFEKGLAYRAKTKVNWCPRDKTVLANEQAGGGVCDRCGTQVEQREIEQWMFKITAYADRLIDDMENLDWPETTKLAQRNWIGRSEGARIKFKLQTSSRKPQAEYVEVFTTRADTLYGATFVVISPELAQQWIDVGWKADDEVWSYITTSLNRTELDRQTEGKEKTGVFTGIYAINPINDEKIPVWVADYVLGHYGTGAIMAVPAHDERDKEFAKKFKLPISKAALRDANEVIIDLKKKDAGNHEKIYHLHDWILSRQRYWGVPIPMIRCDDCGYVPVSEDDLPVKLPKLDDYLPADDGRSPLAKATSWVKATCPKCDKPAERETDTMDTFVDSSWYYLRYTDPNNGKEFAGKERMRLWMPVPIYVGGAEHNTMHLLYSRFFTKALYDLGYVEFDEPFIGRRNHGIVLGPDGQKMSKSRGNVVDPDAEVERYGADTVRMFLAFMAPYEQGGPWDPKGISGASRFLQRVWNIGQGDFKKSSSATKVIHRAVKNVGEDIMGLRFNTAVSELMKALNDGEENMSRENFEMFLKVLAPMAPHITEELWHQLSHKDSIHIQPWPEYDEALLVEKEVTLPVQVNGKVRDTIVVPADAPDSEIQERALKAEGVMRHMSEKKPKKVIIIPGKMVSIVV
ncbi:MAG: leucine--tRNA ligase [Patescibacteria group bacterium]